MLEESSWSRSSQEQTPFHTGQSLHTKSPQIPPTQRLIHFLQQGHTYFNKAAPPNKATSHGPKLFKLPHFRSCLFSWCFIIAMVALTKTLTFSSFSSFLLLLKQITTNTVAWTELWFTVLEVGDSFPCNSFLSRRKGFCMPWISSSFHLQSQQ